jgi:hypothetical protein
VVREEPLPKTPVGKIKRKDLREPFWVGRDRRVAGIEWAWAAAPSRASQEGYNKWSLSHRCHETVVRRARQV